MSSLRGSYLIKRAAHFMKPRDAGLSNAYFKEDCAPKLTCSDAKHSRNSAAAMQNNCFSFVVCLLVCSGLLCVQSWLDLGQWFNNCEDLCLDPSQISDTQNQGRQWIPNVPGLGNQPSEWMSQYPVFILLFSVPIFLASGYLIHISNQQHISLKLNSLLWIAKTRPFLPCTVPAL